MIRRFRFVRVVSVMLLLIVLMSTAVLAAPQNYPNTHVNTGNYREDIVAVAKTQIGYQEGDNNDTKYGDWYGLPNQPWCAMFVSWCARQAGVPKTIVPNSAKANPGKSYFNVPYYTSSEYTPKAGDLYFTKDFSHVGIVVSVDGDYFYSVDGNTNITGGSVGVGVYQRRQLMSKFYFGTPNYGEYKAKNLLGDANDDLVVNIQDVTAIQKHLAEISTLTATGKKLADVNADSFITIKDATAIQKHLADIKTGLGIGKVVA